MIMRLRYLEKKDAPLMLEWMKDSYVVKDMQTDFAKKTIIDCEEFIKNAQKTEENIHLAITNENDEYMGTVSLKHITKESAEFAITVRKVAMGLGYAAKSMKEIIRIGLYERELKVIYWCVSPSNKRAVRFYDKNGYKRVNIKSSMVEKFYSYEHINSYVWYQIER